MPLVETNSILHTDYLTALLGSLDDSVVATDKNFIIQYWNKKAEQLFGITAQEAIGRSGADVLKFNYCSQSREEAREILLTKGLWKGKLTYECKEGKTLLLDASVTVVRNTEGKTIGFVGVHRDITEYDRAKTSLSTFLSLVTSSEDYFFVVDRELKIAMIDDYTNERLIDIYGFRYTVGENVIDKLPENRKEQIRACFQRALAGAKSVYEINITTANGKKLWLQVSYFPVRDANDTITHACSMVKNITAQKEIELVNQMLYKSRKLFETFMENSPIMAWIADKNGTLHYLNPSYLQTFQLSKDAIGRDLKAVFPAAIADSLRENNAIVYNTGRPLQFTEKVVTPNGQERLYQVIKFPIASEDDTYIGGWAIDVTDENALRRGLAESLVKLKSSEQNLKQALEKEHQLNDLKSRFVSMASHEFRTPLSTMLSSVFLLEKYTTTEQQNNRLKHTGKIKEAIQHMNALLDDFLTIGKLEDGKAVATITESNLHQTASDLVEELAPVKKSGQTILLRYTGSHQVLTDKKIIRNILTNLLSNAIKFSHENKEIRLSIDATENCIVIIVKDEGIGISEEDKKHLFETFYRGRNAQNIQGTGLGLNIVQRYVALLNGEINLESELGKGTNVSVRLPYPAPKEAAVSR